MQSPIAAEYTAACLARLDFQVRREVVRLKLENGTRQDEAFRGLYISDEDVDKLLDQSLPVLAALNAPPTDETLTSLDAALTALEPRIQELESRAQAAGVTIPLVHLSRLFQLDSFEIQVITICLAAEVDLKYERLFAYLQDDVTKKRPTVALAMRFLANSGDAYTSTRHYFERDAPLLRWQLVTLNDDPGARRPVLLARYLKLDERITSYLLGSANTEPRLAHCLDDPRQHLGELRPEVAHQLGSWGQQWAQKWVHDPPVLLMHGRYGTGKHAGASILAEALGKPILIYNLQDLESGDLSLEQGLQLAEREALLQDAVLGWSNADAVIQATPETADAQRIFTRFLGHGCVPTVLLSEKPWEPARELNGRAFLRFALPELTYDERRTLWRNRLNGNGLALSEEDLDALAGRFRLTAGQIADAANRAKTLAWEREPAQVELGLRDIDNACRSQAHNRLGTLARKLEPRYNWNDIVLPRAQLTMLHLVCTTVRHRSTVYGSWGFDAKLSLSKGLIALFAGPSGTGKTMAAEIIANDLGLDVYKIDLSSVVSKYIGETEKNLEHIFSEAQDSDAILFFDEADALFGKRSEVKDAHDRYANIEVAYLLQRTEEYNGLVILASNVKKNMDEAFVRRLHFIVDFPFPEEAERLEIWKRTFPRQAPRGTDIDLPFLARKLKVAGGNIRNIILTAAFMAADDHQAIGMRHLVKGAGYEFQKMGKLVVEGDFEGYYDLLKTESSLA